MRQFTQKLSNTIKKHKVVSSILAIIVLACSWWAIFTYMPHPIGNGMDYLGKRDFGALFIGDDEPYSVYYYGTDIAPDDMTQYFTGTTLEYPVENGGSYAHVWLLYENTPLTITYRNSLPSGIITTNKKYLIAVTSTDYSVLKSLAR